MSMLFDWQTLALQTANFAILVWLLHRFLYKPVLRMVDARRAEIQRGYDAAAAAQEQAKAQLDAIQTERAGIAAERDAALKAAAAQAEQAARQRAARAEADADALLDACAQDTGRRTRPGLGGSAQRGTRTGSRCRPAPAGGNPRPSLRTEAWLERIAQHLARLSQAERDRTGRRFPRRHRGHQCAACRRKRRQPGAHRLQRQLGDGASIRFGVDPQLVAGAELHFATAVLRFSWQSALVTIRAELEAHADAG